MIWKKIIFEANSIICSLLTIYILNNSVYMITGCSNYVTLRLSLSSGDDIIHFEIKRKKEFIRRQHRFQTLYFTHYPKLPSCFTYLTNILYHIITMTKKKHQSRILWIHKNWFKLIHWSILQNNNLHCAYCLYFNK